MQCLRNIPHLFYTQPLKSSSSASYLKSPWCHIMVMLHSKLNCPTLTFKSNGSGKYKPTIYAYEIKLGLDKLQSSDVSRQVKIIYLFSSFFPFVAEDH